MDFTTSRYTVSFQIPRAGPQPAAFVADNNLAVYETR